MRSLGSGDAAIAVREDDKAAGAWMGRRSLAIDGIPTFELSFWCGTCPLVFERLAATTRTMSIAKLQKRLNSGIDGVDNRVLKAFSRILPKGSYIPLLLEITPTLVQPRALGDYFSEEQVSTWGIGSASELPKDPQTPYYRVGTASLSDDERLFSFVVPLVPPTWNEADRVVEYSSVIEESSRPTAVALGLLDVRQRADAEDEMQALAHFGLTHFLLDGHHKVQAAASIGQPIRLLSLLSIEHSLALRTEIDRVVAALG